MNKKLFTGAFLAGALALVWVAVGFISSQLLALAVTLLIAAVYALGALELRQFRQATASLQAALEVLTEPPGQLDDWLARVHPALQNTVRLRIEGERIGLPGPALTPYLVGLLVMLGMLGTFLGMVLTLKGAAFSLEGTTDLQAIRAALAAPIKGLGLAFGTSVAGVAASAMLGLMSAISRRERLAAAQQLDQRIATTLRDFSLGHQRAQSYRALQVQAQALPQVVDQLQALMAQMARMSEQQNQTLVAQQQGFHGEVKLAYRELAASVEQTLRQSLTQSVTLAGEVLQPVVQTAMDRMAQESRTQHQRLVDAAQGQLDAMSARLDARSAQVAEVWQTMLDRHELGGNQLLGRLDQSLQAVAGNVEQRAAVLLRSLDEARARWQADQEAQASRQQLAWRETLEAQASALQRQWQQAGEQSRAQQQQLVDRLGQALQALVEEAQTSARMTLIEITRLLASSEELVRARIASEAEWTARHDERMQTLTSLLRAQLVALRDEEAQRGEAAVARLGELQAAVGEHLASLGSALEAPILRLVESASEAPRAAADVIAQLRQQLSHSVAHDNDLLQERSRIMATLHTLLEAINHASLEQRAAIDALLASAAQTLGLAGKQFAGQIERETSRLADAAAQLGGSAVEVASLGEALGGAVQSFGEASAQLRANLQRIEAALDKSMARSDDQLGYYVAQARELIDLSLTSQKEVVEALRQLPASQALPTREPR